MVDRRRRGSRARMLSHDGGELVSAELVRSPRARAAGTFQYSLCNLGECVSSFTERYTIFRGAGINLKLFLMRKYRSRVISALLDPSVCNQSSLRDPLEDHKKERPYGLSFYLAMSGHFLGGKLSNIFFQSFPSRKKGRQSFALYSATMYPSS